MLRMISLALAGGLLVSCSKPSIPKRQMDLGDRVAQLFGLQATATSLKVVDVFGKPVANAQILIGTGVDQPFAENFLATDAGGGFTAPAGWTAAEAVTINAPGYVRATYFEQVPQGQTYVLRPRVAAQPYKLTGQTSGYKTVDRDGIVDFGIVIPSMTKASLFNFDLAAFISPETETISIIGKSIEIPKNIVLPKQRESYFFPIELNKPNYSLNFRGPGERMIYVARGTFPLDDVVNEFRNGKEFFELMNYLSIKGGALRKIDLQGDQTLDLPVNELNYTGQRQIQGPAVGKDEVVLAAALAEWKGWFYPTDVKLLDAGKARSLTVATGGQPSVIAVLKRKDEMSLTQNTDRLSAHFATLDNGLTPSFLPLLEKPKVTSPYEFGVTPVNKPTDTVEGAQFSVLSKVSQITVAGKTLDVLENLWEVYSPHWMATTQIPQWPGENSPSGNVTDLATNRLRWEVTLTALPSQNAVQNVELGPKWLDASSHATRASQDF